MEKKGDKTLHGRKLFFTIVFVAIATLTAIWMIFSSAPNANESPNIKIGETMRISDNHYFGCIDKNIINKLNDIAHQKDETAFDKLLNLKLYTKECKFFKKGKSVYVTDISMGFVKVRQRGQTEEYWLLKQALTP